MIISAAKWQTGATFITFALSLLQLTVLARVFDAKAFGYLAIVMVCVNIYQTLSDLGMANYLVFVQKVSSALNSTVFWVCCLAGIVLCLIMQVTSGLIANYYDMQGLSYLLNVAALALIPVSLGAQLQARYMLEYKLSALAKFDITARLISTSFVIIAVTVFDYGLDAVVFGVVISASVKLLLLALFSDKAWLPQLKFSKQHALQAWGYGKFQVGSQILNKLREELDIIILGMFIDAAKLGLYSLAKQLAQKIASLIVPIVRKLTLPLIAKSRSNLKNLTLVVYKSHCISTVMLVFPHILLLFVAQQVTVLFYSEQKLGAAEYLIPLTIFYMLRSVGGALAGSICQGLGKTNIDFYWNVSVFFIYAIVAFISAQFSELYTAYSYAIIQLLLLNAVYVLFYKNTVSLAYSRYITPIITSLLISLLICVGFMFTLNTAQLVISDSLTASAVYVLLCTGVYAVYCLKKIRIWSRHD